MQENGRWKKKKMRHRFNEFELNEGDLMIWDHQINIIVHTWTLANANKWHLEYEQLKQRERWNCTTQQLDEVWIQGNKSAKIKKNINTSNEGDGKRKRWRHWGVWYFVRKIGSRLSVRDGHIGNDSSQNAPNTTPTYYTYIIRYTERWQTA